jgi:hypothetical protein
MQAGYLRGNVRAGLARMPSTPAKSGAPGQGSLPTIEEQVAELKAAGWIHVRRHIWKAPIGGYFIGPHGAWKAMKRRESQCA